MCKPARQPNGPSGRQGRHSGAFAAIFTFLTKRPEFLEGFMTTSDIEQRLSVLERELRAVRDQLEIYQLTAAYGPAADSGDSSATADLWTEDGEYDWGRGKSASGDGMVEGLGGGAKGRAEIAQMVDGPYHQGVINNGAAHTLSMPHVVVDGDTAISTAYVCVYSHDGDAWRAWRVSASHFQWVRGPDGWKVKRRLNRSLNGAANARALLADGLAGRLPD
jgi:ketosteroid isomerase-like protein